MHWLSVNFQSIELNARRKTAREFEVQLVAIDTMLGRPMITGEVHSQPSLSGDWQASCAIIADFSADCIDSFRFFYNGDSIGEASRD